MEQSVKGPGESERTWSGGSGGTGWEWVGGAQQLTSVGVPYRYRLPRLPIG